MGDQPPTAKKFPGKLEQMGKSFPNQRQNLRKVDPVGGPATKLAAPFSHQMHAKTPKSIQPIDIT